VFLYLSKVIPAFIFPLGFSVVLLAAGVVVWRRGRLGRIFCLLALAMLLFFSTGVVSNVLVLSLEHQYPEVPLTEVPNAQAIVALGGSLRTPGGRHARTELVDSSDRLFEAFELYRAGKAPLVLLTGGNIPFLGGSKRVPESEAASQLLQEWGIPAQAILVEGASRNTRENALFSFRLAQPRAIRHILLVTSASHMPRAAAAFRKVGFDVTPVPADFMSGWGRPDLLFWLLPDAGCLSQSHVALKEWLGLIVYRLRGWA
jgi:uncharacterized SAM-binding protein YcdF (DUF218 family)